MAADLTVLEMRIGIPHSFLIPSLHVFLEQSRNYASSFRVIENGVSNGIINI